MGNIPAVLAGNIEMVLIVALFIIIEYFFAVGATIVA